MHTFATNRTSVWLLIGFALATVSACRSVPATPIEVTRLVPVTQLVVPTVIEVTRLVQAPPIEVTRIVTVTSIVPATSFVPSPVPAPTLMPAPTAAPPPTAVLSLFNSALLVRYDFEGDFLTSGTIPDLSGNAFDAQISGSVTTAEGLSGGQAIFFSGDGYIQAQSNPVAGRTSVSFSLWFKTDQPDANYKLASAAWWNGGPGSGWILATHIPEFWSEDTQSLYLPGLTNVENRFPANEWVHEVVTYDGSHIREYTNGQLVNDWPTTGAAIGQGQPMVVGAWPPFTAYNFQGSIDEFQVFGWALSPQEVQDIYNQR